MFNKLPQPGGRPRAVARVGAAAAAPVPTLITKTNVKFKMFCQMTIGCLRKSVKMK